MKFYKQLLGNKMMLLMKASLLLIYCFNLLLIFRPSINVKFGAFVLENAFFVGLMILSYPLYLGLFYIVVKKYLLNSKNLIFIIVFAGLNIGLFIFSWILQILERLYYPNYIYSSIHIYIPYLAVFSYLEIMIIAFSTYVFVQKKLKKDTGFITSFSKFLLDPYKIVSLLLLVVICKVVVVDLPGVIVNELRQQSNAINMNIEFKFRTTDMPLLAEKGVFIRQNTPNDSTIVIPNQSGDYPDIGNQVLIRYFLFPRTLVSYSKLNDYINDTPSNYCRMYTLVSRSYVDKNKYFPDFSRIKIKRILFLESGGKIGEYQNLRQADILNFLNNDNVLIGLIENQECSQF